MENKTINLSEFNGVSVPIFELNPDGSIKPNPLFHRSWDKLHSRCIEYPYAASKLSNEKRILDVGTTKSDKAWIDWLESLPIEVYATDFDDIEIPLKNVKFERGDVRQLPFKDNYFDAILAVSVIEHIGLEDSQVYAEKKPIKSDKGDIEAVLELKRILKPGGRLIMTFPYSKKAFIYSGSARVYDIKGIKNFNNLFPVHFFEYYEYQMRNSCEHTEEYNEVIEANNKQSPKKFYKLFSGKKEDEQKRLKQVLNNEHLIPGIVTWRKINIEECSSTHYKHIDGVYCGVWEK